MILRLIAVLFIAFAAGIAVSAATVVLISILGIIPDLTNITGTKRFTKIYPVVLWLGLTLGAFAYLLEWELPHSGVATAAFYAMELFMGVYTGVFLCALAEVLNIFPTINRALGIPRAAETIAITFALSKSLGTMLYYLTPVFRNA